MTWNTRAAVVELIEAPSADEAVAILTARLLGSPETIAEVARVGREWPDGIHTCEELQRLEPGRRPCTCGRCGKG